MQSSTDPHTVAECDSTLMAFEFSRIIVPGCCRNGKHFQSGRAYKRYNLNSSQLNMETQLEDERLHTHACVPASVQTSLCGTANEGDLPDCLFCFLKQSPKADER